MNNPKLATVAVAIGLAAATLSVAPAASAHQSSHDDHGSHSTKAGHHKSDHRGDHGKRDDHGKRHGNHHGNHHGYHHGSQARQHVLASGLLSPLRAAIADNGTSYVSENFAGKIDRISRSGTKTTAYTDPNGFEVGGLSTAGRSVVFTVTQSVGEGENLGSWLKVLTPSGQARTIADTHAYEAANNPDQGTTYGFRHIDPTCASKWPTATNGPATYTGAVDSHPYATYVLDNGWTLVADAGGNDVLLVTPNGRIRTVAVLPAIPFRITSQAASGMGLDPCFVGTTYFFEPVPTDVELGNNGTIYVTSLPGGQPGPQLGARGSIFAINTHANDNGRFRFRPSTHHGDAGPAMFRARQVVRGLLTPTGLAVAPDGSMYVAQMFGNEISRVTLGNGHFRRHVGHGDMRHLGARVTTLLSTPTPGEVEWTPRGLYFTSNVLSGTPEDPNGSTTPNGQLIRYGR
jgi:hypothetical protein